MRHGRVIEVGPRDGLQNEAAFVPTAIKLEFIQALASAGLAEIEVSSFVSPSRVPQLADASQLWPLLPFGPRYSALVPNLRGLESALAVGVERIAIFASASEAFAQKNLNRSIDDSLREYRDVVNRFREIHSNGFVRGYVSMVFECPYQGPIDQDSVTRVIDSLWELGVNEISLGDTVGRAVPCEVTRLGTHLLARNPAQGIGALVWHFHDTWGTAIANVQAAIDLGFLTFDASAGGLGGCPFAPGAGGNLATEDLVYLLERQGISTGVDLNLLSRASLQVFQSLGRPPLAKAQRAKLAQDRQVLA